MIFPDGWTQARLSEVCSKIVDGSHNPPKATDSGLPMLSARNIQDRRVNFDDFRFINEGDFSNEHARTNVQVGDVLLTIVGTIGRTAVVAEDTKPFALQRSVAVLKPQEINPRYLSYLLESPMLQRYFQENAKGTAQKGIYLKALAEVEISLAPLNEQKRIADKLDSLLARVDDCRERLDRVPQILKRFRQAVLAAATSGALTVEWRKTNRLKRKWPKVRLGEIGELGRGKSKHRPRNDPRLYDGTYPFIQTGDVARSGGTIHSHTQTYSDFGLAQSKLWPVGTVCITIAANIADTAILSYPACFPDSIVGFIADPQRCLPQFVKWSIDVIRAELEAFAPATAQKNINLAVLNNVEFELPPLVEQHEIVHRVETFFAFADQLETHCIAGHEQIDQLIPSLLDKAFRGELVPQDPNDEPASELLKRIKEQKKNQPEQKRKSRTNTIKNERHMNTKAITTLDELVSVLDQLGGDAMADRLVIESGLSEDIDRFFELLREGRNTLLDIPVGSNKPIRRIVDANQ